MLVYFISGLGADHRVFKNLELPGIEMKFLPWLIPEKDESLHDYASRMIRGIDTSEPVRIVGVSFGGIMAQTIASMITCRQIVLISSVRSPEAYHKFVKWVSKVRLDKVFPMAGLQHFPRKGMDYYFGLETREDSDLLRDMIGHADKYLLRWSVEQVLQWTPPKLSVRVSHIHGTEDRIFPVQYVKDATLIPGGGHFMVLNKSREVEEALELLIRD